MSFYEVTVFLQDLEMYRQQISNMANSDTQVSKIQTHINENKTDGTEVMLNVISMSSEFAVCSTRTHFNTAFLCWIPSY